CLADMPQVDAGLLNRLIAAFDPDRGALIVMPTVEGRRGNPVLWSCRFFPDLMAIEGDVGARHFIGRYSEAVVEVPLEGKAALVDVDTPETLVGVKAAIESVFSKYTSRARGPGRIIRRFDRQRRGRLHKSVQTGSGLLRSQRRSAKSLASMMS